MRKKTRKRTREDLYALLGDLPDRNRNVKARCITTEETEDRIIERLVLDLNGIEPVPACFVKPKRTGRGNFPAVLFNHSHGGGYAVGKEELLE